MTSSLIRADRVSYAVAGRFLLCDVSLSLRAGEVVGLIGPNGAGKSTLLKVLAKIRNPSSGEVELCGQPITRYTLREMARLIGQVQQTAILDAPFSVQEVVAMGRNPHLGRFEIERDYDREVVTQAMRLTNTLDLADRRVNTLSGGERQRVFLARALAQEPAILLLDEPTSNLDIRHQIEILTLVQNLARQRELGVLIAIHDLALAARFCDRLILLDSGQVIADGTPESVLTADHLAKVFAVHAQPYYDPFTHDLKLSIKLDEIAQVVA